jgi:hypothetical protein
MECAAKFVDDGKWYRAEVTKITTNGVLVTFVDYGNTQLCGKLLFAKSFTRIAVDFNLFHLKIVLFVAVI